jgi:hypothetical protein
MGDRFTPDFFGKLGRDLSELVGNRIKRAPVEKALEWLSVSGKEFSKFPRELLDHWNVEADYSVASLHPDYIGPDTTETFREHIKTGPLLVFGNHPGLLDQGLVLELIRRNDAVILTNKDNYNLYSEVGPDHFLIASKNAIHIASDIIKSGGAVVIFPGKSTERKSEKPFMDFHQGISYLMSDLPENCKIVTTLIDKSYVNNYIKRLHVLVMALLDLLDDVPVLTYNIKVEARLSDKSAWDTKLEVDERTSGNRAQELSQAYLSQFGIRSDFSPNNNL